MAAWRVSSSARRRTDWVSVRPHDPQKDRVMKRRSREGFAAFAFRRGFGVTVLRRFCPELRFKIQLVHRLCESGVGSEQ